MQRGCVLLQVLQGTIYCRLSGRARSIRNVRVEMRWATLQHVAGVVRERQAIPSAMARRSRSII